jgi:hypothetical protein
VTKDRQKRGKTANNAKKEATQTARVTPRQSYHAQPKFDPVKTLVIKKLDDLFN